MLWGCWDSVRKGPQLLLVLPRHSLMDTGSIMEKPNYPRNEMLWGGPGYAKTPRIHAQVNQTQLRSQKTASSNCQTCVQMIPELRYCHSYHLSHTQWNPRHHRAKISHSALGLCKLCRTAHEHSSCLPGQSQLPLTCLVTFPHVQCPSVASVLLVSNGQKLILKTCKWVFLISFS